MVLYINSQQIDIIMQSMFHKRAKVKTKNQDVSVESRDVVHSNLLLSLKRCHMGNIYRTPQNKQSFKVTNNLFH